MKLKFEAVIVKITLLQERGIPYHRYKMKAFVFFSILPILTHSSGLADQYQFWIPDGEEWLDGTLNETASTIILPATKSMPLTKIQTLLQKWIEDKPNGKLVENYSFLRYRMGDDGEKYDVYGVTKFEVLGTNEISVDYTWMSKHGQALSYLVKVKGFECLADGKLDEHQKKVSIFVSEGYNKENKIDLKLNDLKSALENGVKSGDTFVSVYGPWKSVPDVTTDVPIWQDLTDVQNVRVDGSRLNILNFQYGKLQDPLRDTPVSSCPGCYHTPQEFTHHEHH